MRTMAKQLLHVCLLSLYLCLLLQPILLINAKKTEKSSDEDDEEKPDDDQKWKKKHITDYNEADLERLLEQWDENDDEQLELEPDELPEWKRPQPQIDLSKLDMKNPQNLLKASKKGKTLMMFVAVSGNPTEKETEEISRLWQSSLYNAHTEVQRYVVGADRVLFVLNDGSKAWDVKDFLVTQDRCATVTIEGQDYPGKGAKQGEKDDKEINKTKPKKKETTDKNKKEEL